MKQALGRRNLDIMAIKIKNMNNEDLRHMMNERFGTQLKKPYLKQVNTTATWRTCSRPFAKQINEPVEPSALTTIDLRKTNVTRLLNPAYL